MIQKNWQALIKPKKLDVQKTERTETHATVVAEPLERGFGHTLGNALRRVLLSSLQGAAVTGIQIEGVLHEFSSINGVHEDVTDIILNIKQLALRMHSNDTKRMALKAKGPAEVTASMIETGHDIEILNQDLVICNLDKGAAINMELTVGTGRGYVPATQNRPAGTSVGFIPVDSVFSPVRSVTYKVENSRVQQVTDYDKLSLTVETNGTVTPDDSVALAARILQDQMQMFVNFEDPQARIEDRAASELPYNRHLLSRVNELELSVRAANCLRNDNIIWIGDLVQKTESALMRTPNFGRKSLEEIKEVLEGMGLSLGMEVPDWPPENIEALAKKIDELY